jgi:hypothetical protein
MYIKYNFGLVNRKVEFEKKYFNAWQLNVTR